MIYVYVYTCMYSMYGTAPLVDDLLCSAAVVIVALHQLSHGCSIFAIIIVHVYMGLHHCSRPVVIANYHMVALYVHVAIIIVHVCMGLHHWLKV